MTVDLGNKAVSADLLHPGVVSKAEPLSESAIRKEAIAGVNGDFFDINGTKAPLGAEIENGEIVKGPENGREQSAGVTVNGIGQLADILLEGSIGFNGEVHPLSSFNQYSIPTNGIGLYTSLWGSASRNGAVSGSKSIHEIIVKDGKVIASNESILNGAILENQLVLIGRENGAAILKQLNVGDDVSIQYSPKVVDGEPFKFAIGGNPMLVKDGVVLNLDDSTTAPRTAVGYSADGKQMYLLIVDGRQTSSRGLTLYEMGKLMKEFGSHHALNLDGGGSTTMVARTPGKEDAEVVNSPSDGTERAVPNGIGIFTEKGNGILSGLNVFTHSTLENSDRVFPGLTRSFSTSGYDNAYDPVQPEKVTWKAKSARFGRIDKDGTFLAKESGKVDVEAAAGKVVGSTFLQC